MKTTINITKGIQIMIITTLLISSVAVTRAIIKNVKHQYSMLPAGSGKTCFYDMIQ
jgi:hypothetical protein